MAATEPLIFDALRTPRGKGKVNGSLHATKPVDLVVGLMHEMLSRNPELDPSKIDDVVLGCVTPIGDQGADIAKTAAIKAGLPNTVSGVQLNRFCASGLEAVNIAAQKVASGWEDLVWAGGVESMSRVPMGTDGGAWAMDPETAYDTSFVPQGIGADLIATIEDFSREDVDAYAARSQERAATAQAEGRFSNSVVPVLDINDQVTLDRDEFIRPGTTVETLGGLKPSFAAMGEMGGFDAVALQKYHWVEKINHVHTPGNSSGIVDGASLVAIGNERTGAELGLRARARILATAVSGADPTIMLTGPAPASKKALAKAGLTVDDLDLVEINEAFAAVVLRFVRDMGLDIDKVNVNGGAIAMGHPLGATGAMILGHAGRRAGAPEQALRPGDPVRRRRDGHRHRRRAHLIPAPSNERETSYERAQHDPLGPGRRRDRDPDVGRPQSVGQHDERRLPGVDRVDGRALTGRARRDHGRDHHLGQEDVLRWWRPQRPQAGDQGARRRNGGVRPRQQGEAARARDARQARRRGDQRRGARRRAGDHARLPSPDRRRRPEGQARVPGGQAGPAARRRRRDSERADVRDRRGAGAAAAAGQGVPAGRGA